MMKPATNSNEPSIASNLPKALLEEKLDRLLSSSTMDNATQEIPTVPPTNALLAFLDEAIEISHELETKGAYYNFYQNQGSPSDESS